MIMDIKKWWEGYWERHPLRCFVILIAILYLAAFLFSFLRIKDIIINPMEGISIFAIFYFIAQFSERVTEPFSNIIFENSPIKIEKNKRKITAFEMKINEALKINPDADVQEWEEKIEKLSKENSDESNKRIVMLWFVASFIGVVFTAVTFGLFKIVGAACNSCIQPNSWYPLSWNSFFFNPHVLDSFISGMIIGGGTKPLHDIISYIEKQS